MSKIQIDVVGSFDDTIKKMSEIERKGLDLNVRSDIVKQFTQATDVLKERTTNALTAAGEAGFGSKFMKKIVKIEDKFKGMMADAHQDATKVGQTMVTNAEKVAKLNKEIASEGISAAERSLKIEELGRAKIRQEELKAQDQALGNRMNSILKSQQQAFDQEMSFIDSATERRQGALDEYMADMKKGNAQRAQEFAEGLKGGISDLEGGDFSGLFKKMGKFLEKKGAGMGSKGEAQMAASGGKSGAMMAKMGPMMAGMGTALAGVAAAVAALAAVIGIFVGLFMLIKKAWEQQTEFNKSILEGAAAGDLLHLGMGRVKDNLEAIRDVATDVGNNLSLGLKPKEVLEVVGGFHKAEIGVKAFHDRIRDGKGVVEKYKGAVRKAVVIATAFGQSNAEVAENMADYMHEMGTSLEDIYDRFSQVASISQNAGFNTKKFYSQILQATSGMTMYNVRLIESAHLLTKLSKVLGKKMGGDMLKSLTDGFKDESFTDSFKAVLKMGRPTAARIMAREAKAQAMDFQRKMSERFGDGAQNILSVMGVQDGANRGEGADQMISHLKNLSPEEIGKTIAKLNQADSSGDLTRQFQNMMDVMRGMSGKVEDLAIAQDALGPGGVLMRQLMAVREIIPKPIHKMNFEELVALQGMEGYSRQQIRQLQRISEEAHASWAAINAQRDEFKAAHAATQRGTAQERAIAKDHLDNLMVKSVESFGGFINEHGQVMVAGLDSTGNRVDVANAAVANKAEELRALQQAYDQKDIAAQTKQEVIQGQVARATMDMSHFTENVIAWFLEQIMKGINYLADILSDEFSDEQEAAKQAAISVEMREQQKIVRELADLNRAKMAAEQGAKTAKTAEAKKAYEDEIKRITRNVNMLTGRREQHTAAVNVLSQLHNEGQTRQKTDTVSEFRSVARGDKTQTTNSASDFLNWGTAITLLGAGALAPFTGGASLGLAMAGAGGLGVGAGMFASHERDTDANKAWKEHMTRIVGTFGDQQMGVMGQMIEDRGYDIKAMQEGKVPPEVVAEGVRVAMGAQGTEDTYRRALEKVEDAREAKEQKRSDDEKAILKHIRENTEAQGATRSVQGLAKFIGASSYDQGRGATATADSLQYTPAAIESLARKLVAHVNGKQNARDLINSMSGLDQRVKTDLLSAPAMRDGIAAFAGGRFKMLTTDHDKGYVVAAQGLNDAAGAGIGGGQPYVDQRTINFHGGNTNEIIEAYRRLGSATLNNAMSGIT